MKYITFCSLLFLACTACKQRPGFDATGTFEANATIIAAKATGEIMQFNLEEGDNLHPGQRIGYIDSTQAYLHIKQLRAERGATLSKRPDIKRQTGALEQQLSHALHEKDRLTKLVAADAATRKQLDDARAQVKIIRQQISARQSSLETTTSSIEEATTPIAMQVVAAQDLLANCRIINPIYGTVLTKYAMPHEMASIGKPLYKIARLDTLILRAYITEDQLVSLQLNEQAKVLVDDGQGDFRPYRGRIYWISDQAEFTPKTIQTKKERAAQVYAIKLKVKNDGYLKIGMYAEVNFQDQPVADADTRGTIDSTIKNTHKNK